MVLDRLEKFKDLKIENTDERFLKTNFCFVFRFTPATIRSSASVVWTRAPNTQSESAASGSRVPESSWTESFRRPEYFQLRPENREWALVREKTTKPLPRLSLASFHT